MYQHEMVGAEMQDMMQHGQVNIPMNNGSHVQPQNNEGTDQYDCKPHQHHHQLNTQ